MMIEIRKIYRHGKKHPIYWLAGADGACLATFDSISDAGAVLRYLNCAQMNESEYLRAVRLLDAIDED